MRSIQDRGEDLRSPRPRPVWAAMAVLAALVLSVPLSRGAHAADEVDDGAHAADWGATWLSTQLGAGIPLETFGSPDWGTTLEAGLALAAVGGNELATEQLWTAVVAERESVVTALGQDVPGRLAAVVLLAVAIGEDPAAVGDEPGADLVSRLEATRTTSGDHTGLYGSQDATYDGAYRQGYALAALTAAGASPDPTAVDWLVAQQCDDGSWMPYRDDLTVPCAFDADAFVGPDSNSTAAAITGLVAVGAGADPAVTDALGWLDAVQEDDGGWPFFPDAGSDPNSTAMVIQSLIAVGELDAVEFTDRVGMPLQALLSFQLGCSEGADAGSFTYPGSGDAPNTFATAQAVSAAAGATLGITAPVVTDAFDDPCPAQVPTTTTTSTTTSTTSTTTPAPTSTTGPDPQMVLDPIDEPGDGVGAGATPGAGSDVAGSGSGRSGALATTGTSTGGVTLVGATMLVLGAVALIATRRRARV